MKKHLITLALAFLASAAALRADTSYLLIQGPFGAGGAEATFKWQVNYQAGVLQTGQDLLDAVFGSPSLSGTYMDGFGFTYQNWVAGNGVKGADYIDFNNSSFSAPFVVSFTLNSTSVAQTADYNTGWIYYLAGGGSNLGNGYDNDGAWTFGQDGTLSRSLVNGSFDAFVYGATSFGDPVTFVDGANNAPTAPNFVGVTVINVVPEPASAALMVFCGGGMLALLKRRRA